MSRRRSNSGRAPAHINATFVPRRGVPSDGFLFLWGPDKPSRFPWLKALARLGLPIDDDMELESTSVKLVLPRDNRFKIINTHGVAISTADAVPMLGTVQFDEVQSGKSRRRRYKPTSSLVAWSLASKLALELISRQSFVPSARRASRGRLMAVWLAAVEASHDIGRVRRLATDMPVSAHALLKRTPRRRRRRRRGRRRRRRAPRVWHPELMVRAFLDAAVDSLVRQTIEEMDEDYFEEILEALAELEVPESEWDARRALGEEDDDEDEEDDDEDEEDDDEDEEDDDDEEDDEEDDDEDDEEDDSDDTSRDSSQSSKRSSKNAQGGNGKSGNGKSGNGNNGKERRKKPRRRHGLVLSEAPLSELRRWEYRWMKGITGPHEDCQLEFHHDDPKLQREFEEWLSWVIGKGDNKAKEVDAKTGLWLEMPEDNIGGDEAYWYLRYMLVAANDPSLAVPAQQVFNVGTSRLRVFDHSFDRPQEKMLEDLGYAGRLFQPVKESLENARPEGVYLDTSHAWRFISEAGPVLYAAGFDVRLPETLTGQGERRLRARLRIRDARSDDFSDESQVGLNDLAAFQWEAALGDESISAEEFRQIAELKQPLVRWRGTWVMVDPLQMKNIEEMFEQARAAGTMTRFEALSRALTGVADPTDPSAGVEVIVEGKVAELVEQMSSDELLEEEVTLPETFHGELRPYQERGLAWLVYQSRLGLGCCLADDMGLGKTIQMIALLLFHAKENPKDKRGTLLVCPTSVVGNWQRELAKFGPSLNVIQHHGTSRADTITKLNKQMSTPNTVVITSYGLATRDVDLLKKRKWARFVLDEAQAIKNISAKRSQAVREIDAEFRVALTGTPIENRLSELWSILDFLNPGLLGSHDKFRRAYGIPIERYQDPDALEGLRKLVGPFILRRVKTDPDVIQDLPDKMEMKVYCTLTREQASLYQALVDNAMAEIESADGITRHGRVLALLTRLKQVVNHPALYMNKEQTEPVRSGKFTRLLEMLDEVIDSGDRALIFTQFKQMGDLLVDYISERFDVEVPFLHGGVPQASRDDLVDTFQDEDGPPVFVLSLKAGGTGLNLTAANHVFHFDRWWNPAVEDQATDRAFRIGQTRNVQVHKMISLGTLEEKIDAMLTEKKNLAETIVDSTGAWVTELDTNALRDLVSLGSEATIDDAD